MDNNVVVTPWEVSGDLNEKAYAKIAKEFGVKIIDEALLSKIKAVTKDLHPFLLDGLFFAHRDLDTAIDSYKAGEELYLYTGRGPSGKMHLGHLLPFIFTKWLQERLGVHLLIQITDDEKYLVKDTGWEEIQKYVKENVADIISLGFEPSKTHIIIDSMHAGILYDNAVKFAKHVTASTVKAVFGIKDSENIGKFFFPSIQAVPSFLVSAIKKKKVRCLIPYSIDQDDYFRVARDVLPKMGYYKPSSIISKFVGSLQGGGKMSSSSPTSSIFLDDDEKTVRKKLMKYAFSGGKDTVEDQRKYGANPEIDFAFNMYRMLSEDHGATRKVYEEYKSGKMLSGEMKELAASTISRYLHELQARRKESGSRLHEYLFKPERFG